jgi:sarcosine oxidase subunit alpha
MAHRLNAGGALVDRSQPITFAFNGETLQGFEGDTLASALLANDKVMVGRSFKYHRPRGILASGAEEPNALMGVGEGPRFEPNQRATTTELYHGLVAKSQNHWPSLNFDVGGMNAKIASLAPVFSAGFYYKTFMFPRAAWKHLYEPVIRNAAGLGKPPTEADPDTYEHFHAFCDVLVVGGGLAGIAAARAAGEAGAKVLLV